VRVFISYAREDADEARRLYMDLKAAGADPWLDEKDLRGGQRWKRALNDAISQCRYFVALLSSNSVNKRGYVQKEVRHALEVLDEFSESDVFLIPVRLDGCRPTNQELRELQWVDLFPHWHAGVAKLLLAMQIETGRAAGQGLLEILKRIYVEANGSEAQMLDAIRGLQNLINVDSHEITDDEWSYIVTACPGSVVELLKSSMGPRTANEAPAQKKTSRKTAAKKKTPKKKSAKKKTTARQAKAPAKKAEKTRRRPEKRSR
jgi:hypothetical protein